MSAVLSIAAEAELSREQPVFYFDFGPVLALSRGLQRNPERAALMCEHCVRRLAPADVMIPDRDGFFLVMHSATGSAAEALAHEINLALLELFFGTEARDKSLSTICRRATLAEIEVKGITPPPRPPAPSPATGQVEADPLRRLSQSGLAGYEGLSTGFVPLINLKRGLASVFLCGPVRQQKDRQVFGDAAYAGIDARDRASLEEALLEYSLSFARAMTPTEQATAIATSVSFETLAGSRGRQLYQKALRAASVAANPFLVVKIDGIPAGTPQARLAEIVSVVRPFVRRVFLELPDWDLTILQRGGVLGVAGLMARMPAEAVRPPDRSSVTNLVRLAASQRAVACITGLANADQMGFAKQAGVHFAARCDQTRALAA
jgi:hypothetical protein